MSTAAKVMVYPKFGTVYISDNSKNVHILVFQILMTVDFLCYQKAVVNLGSSDRNWVLDPRTWF